VDRLATSNQSSVAQSIVLMDAEDNRRALKVPPGTLSMQSVTSILEAAKDELCSGRVDTVLFSRIELQAAPSAADEESSMAHSCNLCAYVEGLRLSTVSFCQVRLFACVVPCRGFCVS